MMFMMITVLREKRTKKGRTMMTIMTATKMMTVTMMTINRYESTNGTERYV